MKGIHEEKEKRPFRRVDTLFAKVPSKHQSQMQRGTAGEDKTVTAQVRETMGRPIAY